MTSTTRARRGGILAALVGLFALLGGMLFASPASAASCTANSTGTHCYSTIGFDAGGAGYTPQATRLQAAMHWTCATPSAIGYWMTAASLWGGNQDGGTTEMGFITPPDGPHPRKIPVNYWVRYGGSYGSGLQLYYTTFYPNRNQDYTMRMNWTGSQWQLTRDGTQIGLLSSPTGPLKTMQTGGEISDSNNNNASWRVSGVQRVQGGVTYSGTGSPQFEILGSPPFNSPADEKTASSLANHVITATRVACL